MADIGKINAVALANIAKVDAVAAAAIAKINGLVFTTAAGFLLDTYTGAAAGYSTRRLATSATNLMRIREDAGDTETDIGYDSNNELDTAAIATHCGTANGYVVTWYDQANSNNATQSTEANQPQIYDGTAVITENGKAAIQLDGINDGFISSVTSSASNYGLFYVMKRTDDNGWLLDTQSGRMVMDAANNSLYFQSGFQGSAINPTTQSLIFLSLVSPSSGGVFINGVSNQSGLTYAQTAIGGTTKIGKQYDSNINSVEGSLQEFILYAADQSSNRSGIEENINSDFLIYQPTDAPTSGLLADYTGAAAAYSVRQLSDKAVIALRVRRDSDDVEQNFGFDSNGDLDTAGIASFCGTANGYVTRWWDQSTNGNHADQATDASQPQIYNGTAVITENGKPALSCDTGSATYLLSGSNVRGASDDFSVFSVGQTQGNYSYFWSLGNSNSNREGFARRDGTNTLYCLLGSSQITATTATLASQRLHTYTRGGLSSDSIDIRIDSSAVTISGANSTAQSLSASQLYLGSYFNGSLNCTGTFQEYVVYASDQSSPTDNRSGIETDINDYFDIYT